MNRLIPSIVALLLAGCHGPPQYAEPKAGDAPRTGMANPASVHCQKLGGTLEIRKEDKGDAGYCHFSDGRVCEEWALYRDKECVTPLPRPVP